MKPLTLIKRTLRYHLSMSVAVALGVAAATSAIAGALIVGDSMRASLRDMSLRKLGSISRVMSTPRFFRQALANDLMTTGLQDRGIAPLMMLRGQAVHADSRARANNISVRGVTDQYFELWAPSGTASSNAPIPKSGLAINQSLATALATALDATVGDDLILHIENPQDISPETILGKSDRVARTLRLPISSIFPDVGPFAFDTTAGPQSPLIACVNLDELQAALDREGAVNTLIATTDSTEYNLSEDLHRCLTLDDVGAILRRDPTLNYAAVESDRFLVDPVIERAAVETAESLQARHGAVLTYLANEIALPQRDASIPYSTIAGISPDALGDKGFLTTDGSPPPTLGPNDIFLNDWAARAAGAEIGDQVQVSYYVTSDAGRLETQSATFTLRAIVQLDAAAADPNLTPPYEGVTNVNNLADWDPPFPVDLNRVQPRDEEYWDQYRATPKAFIALETAQSLWADEGDRFGRATSIRLMPPEGQTLDTFADQFESAFLKQIPLQQIGLTFVDVRAAALNAAKGSTDFAGLFIGFSLFLILSALILVTMLFRLGVERRAAEIGLLLAIGTPPRRIRRWLVVEAVAVSSIGALFGLVGAIGYAHLMLAGLGSWWKAAVNTDVLRLSVTPVSLGVGFIASVLAPTCVIAFTLRKFCQAPAARLLQGDASPPPTGPIATPKRSPILAVLSGIAALTCVVAPFATPDFPESVAFFLAGALAMTSALATASWWLSRGAGWPTQAGSGALLAIARRNAPRHATRSVMTMTLIASAAFLVSSLQAFRIDPDATDERTGGFTHFAESTTPIPFRLANPIDAESAGLSPTVAQALHGERLADFRLRPGENTSCVNLYLPQRPRILGAPKTTIAHGGFKFSAILDADTSQHDNPWRLLNHTFDDGAIPAIGDEAAVKWQLHSGLGKDFTIEDERGQQVRLRFVALLKESVLQDELIVAESNFKRLFPSISGYGFFLLSAEENSDATQSLERDLTRFGLDVRPCSERLEAYFAVQNTYLSTFQSLGGLGLALGVVGLSAVLLRNVWERRGELALMQAIGFTRRAVARIVFLENALLVALGLACGLASAMLAVAPRLTAAGDSVSLGGVAILGGGVAFIAFAACAVALSIALRKPLLSNLREA